MKSCRSPAKCAGERQLLYGPKSPKNVSPVKALGSIGGVNPFIKFNELGSNGLVGATRSASIAIRIKSKTMTKETIVIGDRLKS